MVFRDLSVTGLLAYVAHSVYVIGLIIGIISLYFFPMSFVTSEVFVKFVDDVVVLGDVDNGVVDGIRASR